MSGHPFKGAAPDATTPLPPGTLEAGCRRRLAAPKTGFTQKRFLRRRSSTKKDGDRPIPVQCLGELAGLFRFHGAFDCVR